MPRMPQPGTRRSWESRSTASGHSLPLKSMLCLAWVSELGYRKKCGRIFLNSNFRLGDSVLHVVHSHAASAAGETENHRNSYVLAVAALEHILNEEERRIVASTFLHVPKPRDNA